MQKNYPDSTSRYESVSQVRSDTNLLFQSDRNAQDPDWDWDCGYDCMPLTKGNMTDRRISSPPGNKARACDKQPLTLSLSCLLLLLLSESSLLAFIQKVFLLSGQEERVGEMSLIHSAPLICNEDWRLNLFFRFPSKVFHALGKKATSAYFPLRRHASDSFHIVPVTSWLFEARAKWEISGFCYASTGNPKIGDSKDMPDVRKQKHQHTHSLQNVLGVPGAWLVV